VLVINLLQVVLLVQQIFLVLQKHLREVTTTFLQKEIVMNKVFGLLLDEVHELILSEG
jgi:hypothetical protein